MTRVIVVLVRNIRSVMGNKKISLISFVFILILLSVFLYYNNEVLKLRKQLPEKKEISKSFKLQRGANLNWNTIYDNLENKETLLSDNYFIVSTSGYEPRAQISALNLKTGKELILYNELTRRPTSIGQILRLDNTLYFATGGYLAPSNVYYIDFPLENNVVNKVEGEYANAAIEEIDGNYWIVSSEGDACVSGGSYNLFDLKTKKSIFKVRQGNDCGNGNELIIFNDKIINAHFVNKTDYEYATSTYTNITKIDLRSPFTESNLIGNDQMPKDIYGVTYDKATNSLFLSGSEKYIYSLDNGTLMKKDFTNKVDINKGYVKWNEKRINELKSMILPEGYRISDLSND